MKKYTLIFYKGEPVDITQEERDYLLNEMNNPGKKFIHLKRINYTIMFGNIAIIQPFGASYEQEALDVPYNPNQIEEPKTYVKPETKKKLDEAMKKFKTKFTSTPN